MTELPTQSGWQFEPKWDGFRCLAFRTDKGVELRAKSGKPLTRYFPEVVAALESLRPSQFVLDGELVIAQGNSLSFDSLQARLHPAESRIRRLAAETPAMLIAFDLLMDARGRDLRSAPLTERRAALESFFEKLQHGGVLRVSAYTRTRTQAQRWLTGAGAALDGVIAKRMDGPYLSGERAMMKVKHLRTADCVVGGFRYGTESSVVGSLLLGLYDDEGKLNHVGFTSSIAVKDRAKLTARLKKLIAPPGFTGDAPGGPSRWSNERSTEWEPLKPALVVEVQYDQVTGGRFRHGTKLLRWRPDKAAAQCTSDQIQAHTRPAALTKLLG